MKMPRIARIVKRAIRDGDSMEFMIGNGAACIVLSNEPYSDNQKISITDMNEFLDYVKDLMTKEVEPNG